MFLSLLAIRRRRAARKRRQPIRPNMGPSSAYNLPEELIELILSICPLKSVVRFKSVSKSWQSIISSSCFSRIHHVRRSKLPENQNKFLICKWPDSYRKRLYMIGLEDGKVEKESWSIDVPENLNLAFSSCDGLILLRKSSVRGSEEYVLWNPFIRKHIIISHKSGPDRRSSWLSSVDHLYYYDSDYKIVFVCEDWYAVYSCKTGSWGEKQDLPCDPRSQPGFSAGVDGCIYSMQPDDGILPIVCFDVRDGKVHELPKPEGAECLFPIYLYVVSGRLCLYGCTKDGGGFQLWVMERNHDYGCRSWRKLISNSMEEQGRLLFYTCPVCLSNEDDVVLWSHGNHFIYNSRQKSIQVADFTWDLSRYYFPYQENLYLMP